MKTAATGLLAAFERAAAAGLEEDLAGGGPGADVTTAAVIPAGARGAGTFTAKADGVVCGLPVLDVVYRLLDADVDVRSLCAEGASVVRGTALARVEGPLRALVTGERTALNILAHLSGIATYTRRFVERAGTTAVMETRKTHPGLRTLEKYAVRTGGGTNHRFGLWDAVLIKDNHAAAAGGVGEAVRRARSAAAGPVEVECSTPADVLEALEAGADIILLDNHDLGAMRAAVETIRATRPEVVVEASGGVGLADVADVAATGVDRISVGALTHSAPALDISFDMPGD